MEEEKDEDEVIEEEKQYEEAQKQAQKGIMKTHVRKYVSFIMGVIFATLWFVWMGRGFDSIFLLLGLVIGVAALEIIITYFGKYYPSKSRS